MKKIKFILPLVAIALASFSLVSCSDDDDFDPTKQLTDGMTAYRAFVLSEGSYGMNNSHLVYVNPNTFEASSVDAYESANGQKIGDTAQGMIEYDGDIYYVANGSGYVARLDASGNELARYSTTTEQGQPRYIVAYGGKIYLTAYGGYIIRLDAKTLSYEAQVATDANPEQIAELDGKLYAVCSGYGAGNTMTVVSASSFSNAESKTIMSNPQYICEAGDKLYIIAADEYYNYYVSEFDPKTGSITRIADGSRMAAVDDKLYIASSTSDNYITYTNTFYVYDTDKEKLSSWNLSLTSAPEAFSTKVIYMIAHDDENDMFYIGATDYSTNGTVCVFCGQGYYQGSFSAGGINPNSMVFLNAE